MKLLLLSFLLTLSSVAQIPLPLRLEVHQWPGDAPTVQSVRCNEPSFKPQVQAFLDALAKLGVTGTGFSDESALTFSKSELKPGLTYQITPVGNALHVVASKPEGIAHATATLLQQVTVSESMATFPMLDIEDGPSNSFRCFMVDMGRNSHSPKTLRQVVDMMWFYKGNYLQLHLSDDQLVSWQSKAFPKLNSERAGWTWEDFEELEAYSQARGVTIIPEVDVPGHSTLFRKIYPEVFGKTTTELATKPEAQKGVETLIKEVLSVFQSTPYFHMGGDEAYGVPQEVQRNFINRINQFVKAQGKQMLVWEGPHLGKGGNKVDTDVIHMLWRGIEVVPQDALDAGYTLVAAPWDPLYIVDHYPRTMFTAVDVKRCYDYNITRWSHINHEMTNYKKPHFTKSKEGIIGYCMPWWEGRQENLMPLCLPRFAALSAGGWNRKGEQDFASYQVRQTKALPILEKISGIKIPALPVAESATQKGNLAFRAKVTPSDSATQPHFGPQRLTNGLTDRFDHFLGYPTRPNPLNIVVELAKRFQVTRIVVFEAAVGKSYEQYEVHVSVDGAHWEKVSSSGKGSRGEKNFVEHKFDAREAKFIKIATDGCQALTFPSFSRLCEIQAFEE